MATHLNFTANLESLRERLKQAVLRHRDLDLEIAGEWPAADQEDWEGLDRR